MILSLLSSELSKLPDASQEVVVEERDLASIQAKSALDFLDIKKLLSITQRTFQASRTFVNSGVSLHSLEAELRKAPFYVNSDSGDDFI